MNGVVSFSLYGPDDDDVYHRGAIRNAEMYADLRPDWDLKFYVGKSVPGDIVTALRGFPNVSIVTMSGVEDRTASYWRFFAMRSGGYDFYLSRDTDSRPFARELVSVDEFLESDKYFHVMRDHPRHGAVMLAGMWGCKEAGAVKIRRRIRDRIPNTGYQSDQDWLKRKVWPLARRSVLAHVDFDHTFGGEVVPFTVPRDDCDYVAECHNGDDTLRFPDHRLEIAIRGRRAEI